RRSCAAPGHRRRHRRPRVAPGGRRRDGRSRAPAPGRSRSPSASRRLRRRSAHVLVSQGRRDLTVATWTFVRHGQSVANAEGWLAGCLDSPLTARGLAEADATRDAVADIPLARAFASDLSRARLTAQRL